MVVQKTISFSTAGNTDIVDLTPLVIRALDGLDVSDGIVTVFAPGATGGITTIEYEAGLISDFKKMLAKLAPENDSYEHNRRWGDGNAHSHLRASLVGPSLSVPFAGKRLTLGTWQQIVFVDFDVRPRKRTLVLQIVGEDEQDETRRTSSHEARSLPSSNLKSGD